MNIPLNHYKMPLNHYKMPLNHYKIPLNHYKMPLNHYKIPLNHYKMPLNHYKIPLNHYKIRKITSTIGWKKSQKSLVPVAFSMLQTTSASSCLRPGSALQKGKTLGFQHSKAIPNHDMCVHRYII